MDDLKAKLKERNEKKKMNEENNINKNEGIYKSNDLERIIKQHKNEQTIESMNQKLNETKEEIKNLEKENKKVIKEANVKEAKLKEDINGINNELEKIKYGTIPAEAAKVFELKKGCEEVVNLKNENNKLREKLYLLSRRLYSLEVRKLYFHSYIFYFYRWNIVIL